jgi:hypothetical protein
MPYIPPDQRADLDHLIDALVTALKNVDLVSKKYGATNYTLTRILLGALKPETGWNYSTLSHALGVLNDMDSEIRQRLLEPYEMRQMCKNGDLTELNF